MHYVQLNQGNKIPQLGLGVYQTADGQQTMDAVCWALEAGYRHIDTAKIYGNEKSVGDAIRASKIPRQQIFLTTKLWNDDIRAGRTEEAFNESLAALQTDYIDLYLIHWPAEGFTEAWTAMEKLYKQGRIRAIGVSNFHKCHLDELEKRADIKPAVNQVESHPYFNNNELIDYCFSRDIAVEVWSPLGGTGGNLLQDETLVRLAEKYGRTPAQIVLRWDIQRNVVVIPKSTHRERIVSNQAIFDFELSDQDMEAVTRLNRATRVGADPEHFNFEYHGKHPPGRTLHKQKGEQPIRRFLPPLLLITFPLSLSSPFLPFLPPFLPFLSHSLPSAFCPSLFQAPSSYRQV